MKVASQEGEWVLFVKQGQLDKAFEVYQKNFISKLIISLPTRWLGEVLLSLLRFWTLNSKRAADASDTATDLSDCFILFWKAPNTVGLLLAFKIIRHALSQKTWPLRAIAWASHWLVFQGNYSAANAYFEWLNQKTPELVRLRGEMRSLYAQCLYAQNQVERAFEIHDEAHSHLSQHGDKFFQVFNLGTWVRVLTRLEREGALEQILEKFDSLNPQIPDERYGLKLLSHCSYIYLREGKELLSQNFRHSAQKVYEVSGSELDKASFQIVESLIFSHAGQADNAKSALQTARAHLKAYGRYHFYDELMDAIEKLLQGEPLDELELSLLYGNSKSRSLKREKSELLLDETSWYRHFFQRALPLFENLEEAPLSQILDLIETQTCANEFQIKEAKDQEAQPYLKTEFLPLRSRFHFNLVHRDRSYDICLESPFLPWRNAEIFRAMKNTVLSLQALGFQEALSKSLVKARAAESVAEQARQISHDIRSPLSALEVLVGDVKHADPEVGYVFEKSVERIQGIVVDLHSKSKFAPARTDQGINVRELINDMLEEKSREYSARFSIEFKVEDVLENDHVFFDRSNLMRIVSNLLNNAAEAMDGNGIIKIYLKSIKDFCHIQIKDSGPGFCEEVLKRLGEFGLSMNKPKGSGRGLAHAFHTLKASKASIQCENPPHGGALVTLKLPKDRI